MKQSLSEKGNPESYLTLERSIGNLTYTVNQCVVNGKVKWEEIDTKMEFEEIDNFQEKWEKNWRPAIGEGSTGIITTMFEKLDKFILLRDY